MYLKHKVKWYQQVHAIVKAKTSQSQLVRQVQLNYQQTDSLFIINRFKFKTNRKSLILYFYSSIS